MGGYKDGLGEELVSGKRGKKKRKCEAKEIIRAVWVYLPSSPASEQKCLEWDKKVTDHLTKLLSI